MSTSKLRHHFLLWLSAFTVQITLAQTTTAAISSWVDIEIKNGMLLIETEISGIRGYSMVDTGAQTNAINGRFLHASELSFPKGRPIEIEGVFERSRHSTYNEVPVIIFGVELPFSGLVELDIGSPDLQLIVGAGFLQHFVFQFDYPNKRMRFITRDSVDLKKIKNVESRRDPDGGSPLVRVRLSEKKRVWLSMDTGANGGIIIDRPLASKLRWLDLPKVERTTRGANSSGAMLNFNAPSVVFGGFEITNPIVSIPAPGEDPRIFRETASVGSRIPDRKASRGLLGYDILKHFVVTIDYKRGHVHITPGDDQNPDVQ